MLIYSCTGYIPSPMSTRWKYSLIKEKSTPIYNDYLN